MDFFVLDMKASKNLNHTPIILKRPFLATAKVLINCKIGIMHITFGSKNCQLNIFKASQKNKVNWGSIEVVGTIEQVLTIHTEDDPNLAKAQDQHEGKEGDVLEDNFDLPSPMENQIE